MITSPQEREEECLRECRRYYHQHVELDQKQRHAAAEAVTAAVNEMLEFINLEDTRFDRQPVTTGSYRQRLKVTKADEFDFNVRLAVDTSRWVISSGQPRYFKFDGDVEDPVRTMDCTLRLIQSTVALPNPPKGYVCVADSCVRNNSLPAVRWEDVCFGGTVVPFLVRKRLRQLMVDAQQRRPNIKSQVAMSRKLAGPALSFRVDNPLEGQGDISVDISPYFDMPHLWPQDSDWPRQRTYLWLSKDKINRIKSKGTQAVPKKNFDWLVSYAEAETEILDGIDADEGNRRKCLRILKHLNAKFWCKTPKPVLSSYVLKNLTLWECEETGGGNLWSSENLWQRLKGLTARLRRWVHDRNAPLYFNSAINLFLGKDVKEIDDCGKNLNKFMDDPLSYLRVR